MINAQSSRKLKKLLLPGRRLSIIEACIIGLISGLGGVLLKSGVGTLGSMRVQAAHLLPPLFILPVIGLSCGLLAGWLVQRFAPDATGGGIPQVKTALNAFSEADKDSSQVSRNAFMGVGSRLDWRTALVKLISCSLTSGSGMTLGRQGPTVQIGAALAAETARVVPTSPSHRRQMIAAGAAAGLAAGFNTPIAGVLFVVEELLHDFSELTLGTAIIASFIGAVVSRLLGGQSLNLNLHLSATSTNFSAPEIPYYLVLGILGGVLGCLFHQGIFTCLAINRRLQISLPMSVGLAGLMSGIAIALMGESFYNHTGLRQLLITGEATATAAAIAFIAHFLLTCIAYGSGAPGGLFAPSLVIGSALGYLIGVLQYQLLGVSQPTTYALAGMGTFFSAVSRAPITGIVIVFEMTTDFNLVLPLMIGSVVAYLVADQLGKTSLYTRLLAWNGIQIKPYTETTNNLLTQLVAEDVMQSRVETLAATLPLNEVVQAFVHSHHRGFPVVEDGMLVGIVTQTDLAKSQSQNFPEHTPLREIMTPDPVTVKPTDSLSDVLYRLNRYQLSRLPVTEGWKLVGIITRSDIIRAESDQLNGQSLTTGLVAHPSYVVYQTQSPAIGRGRILVPLANPQTAPMLLRLAAAIARDHHYELECLAVIVIPRISPPDQTPVNTKAAKRLLREATRVGKLWEIPVHTQIRVTHEVSQAILETIKQRHIDLMVMGWKGNTTTPGRIFGDVVDTVIRQAPCEVILVKWATRESQGRSQDSGTKSLELDSHSTADLAYCPIPMFNRWLVPMRGGPNSLAAIRLIPALVKLSSNPAVELCQVFPIHQSVLDAPVLTEAMDYLDKYLQGRVTSIRIRASSVVDAVVDQAKDDDCDVVVLGASREGLLQQAIHGNIPEAIAKACDCTVMLVREAIH